MIEYNKNIIFQVIDVGDSQKQGYVKFCLYIG